MPNTIKDSGHGLALQVTKPARSAGLVEENSEGEWTRLAPIRVYAFNNLLLVVDREEMSDREVAELVAVTAKDTKSIFQGIDASVQEAGNGYKIQLPAAEDAAFAVGNAAPVYPAPNMLVITHGDEDGTRLAKDLVVMRRDQCGDRVGSSHQS